MKKNIKRLKLYLSLGLILLQAYSLLKSIREEDHY